MPAFRQSIAALAATSICLMSTVATPPADAQTYSPAVARSLARTQKPPLHGQHWMAITGIVNSHVFHAGQHFDTIALQHRPVYPT